LGGLQPPDEPESAGCRARHLVKDLAAPRYATCPSLSTLIIGIIYAFMLLRSGDNADGGRLRLSADHVQRNGLHEYLLALFVGWMLMGRRPDGF
jgi:hypothetical protein